MYGVKYQTTKIFARGDVFIGLSGDFGHAHAMMDWLTRDGKRENFPKPEGDGKGHLLVIHRDGVIHRYECSPYPLVVEDKFHANGSGREFALAAMELGKTSQEAVALACRMCADCGMGMDVLRFA